MKDADKVLGLKDCEADFVKGIPPVPAILRANDPHEEEARREPSPSRKRGIRRAERFEIAFHADISLCAEIAVELAEQGIAIFFCPIGEVSNEAFDLLTGGFAEGFGAAEIDGVGLDQVGIELMLPDQLAETVADFGTAVVSAISVSGLGR